MTKKAIYSKSAVQQQNGVKEPVAGYVINENKPFTEHLEAINQLCIKHKVENLYLFGSAAEGALTPTSDVDFLIKFKDFDLRYYLGNFLELKEGLESLLNRKVDLVEEQTLKNPVLIQSINNNKILIYG